MSHNSKFYLAVYNSKKIPKMSPNAAYFFPNASQGPFPKIAGKGPDFLKTFLLFLRSENLYKILIYTSKYYFGNVELLYLNY